MTQPNDMESDIETGAGEDAVEVSAPDSVERRQAMAAAVDDVNAGVAAETYDTDGLNTEP